MADNLGWIFDLVDKMSAPAATMGRALKSIEVQTDSATKAIVKFEDAQKKASTKGTGWLDVFKGQGLLDSAKGFAGGILDAAVSFGKMTINSLMYKENTLVALKSMLGSADESEKMFKMATDFARLTPFDTNEVIDSFKSLLASGFKKEEVPIVFQAIGDAKALGGDKADMDTMTRAMMRIKAEGRATMRELMELATGSGGAAPMQGMFDAIGKNLHKTREEVMAMEKSGNLNGDEAILGFLDVMKNKSGQLGTAMIAANSTLSGIFSNVRNTFNDMVMSIDSKKMPGMETFKSAMLGLSDVFNANTPTGKRFMAVVENLVNKFGELFKPFAGEGGAAVMEAKISDIIGTIETLVEVAGGAWKVIKFIGDAFYFLGESIGIDLAAFANLFEWFGKMIYLGETWGKSLIDGIISGITNAAGSLKAAIMDVAKNYISDPFTSMMGIHSPSTLFEKYGENTTEGYQKGLESGVDGISASINSLAVKPAAQMSQTGGGSPISINFEVNIDAQGNDGEAIARKLNDILPNQILAMFEQIAMQRGVA